MRFGFIILILTTTMCSPRATSFVPIENDKLFGDITDGLPDKDSRVTIKNETGQIIAEGQCAVYNKTTTNIRVGSWTEFHDNGKIKTQGQYKIGTYIECCVGGYCRAFYFYRTGQWKYFDSKGNIEYELEFTPEKLKVDTRCGDDTLTFGLIKNIPIKYWDSLTTDKVYEMQKIAFKDRDSVGTSTYTPLNGELFINFSRDK